MRWAVRTRGGASALEEREEKIWFMNWGEGEE